MSIKERFLEKRVRKQTYIEPIVWNTLVLIAHKKKLKMNEFTRNILWDAYYKGLEEFPELKVQVQKK